MSWRRVIWLFGIAVGFAAFSAPANFIGTGQSGTWLDLSLNFFQFIIINLLSLTPILVALTIVDNCPLIGAKRVAALAVALLLAAQVQWPLKCTLIPGSSDACDGFPSLLWRSWKEMWDETTWTIAIATPIALAYFWRRHDQRVAQALFDAEVARAHVQRRTLETDLQAMQARVEPSFLFDTLGDIGDMFDRDPASGARMLDELIRYLRAALPDMRVTTSTLKQEIALVHSYLAILRIRARGRLSFEINLPRELEPAVAPPMTILPIVAAAARATETDTTDSSIRLDVTADDERIRVAISGRGSAIQSLRDTSILRDGQERLRAMYAGRASLAIGTDTETYPSIRLEIPHESP